MRAQNEEAPPARVTATPICTISKRVRVRNWYRGRARSQNVFSPCSWRWFREFQEHRPGVCSPLQHTNDFFAANTTCVPTLRLALDAHKRSWSCTARGIPSLHMSKGVRVVFSDRQRAWWLHAFKPRQVEVCCELV